MQRLADQELNKIITQKQFLCGVCTHTQREYIRRTHSMTYKERKRQIRREKLQTFWLNKAKEVISFVVVFVAVVIIIGLAEGI